MIITCSNCKKHFKINPSQIPTEGRNLKCGSCDHIWFYKIENKNVEQLTSGEEDIINEVKSTIVENDKEQINKNKENISGKFFSYLVVSIVSFVALVILLDTLKTPIIRVFPGLEIILFNLFEILKDIKLFIIDLY